MQGFPLAAMGSRASKLSNSIGNYLGAYISTDLRPIPLARGALSLDRLAAPRNAGPLTPWADSRSDRSATCPTQTPAVDTPGAPRPEAKPQTGSDTAVDVEHILVCASPLLRNFDQCHGEGVCAKLKQTTTVARLSLCRASRTWRCSRVQLPGALRFTAVKTGEPKTYPDAHVIVMGTQ